jgi:hypothetical protein
VLLRDEMVEVKVLVKLVCLGSRVTEEPLLIQLLRGLFESMLATEVTTRMAVSAYVENFLRRHVQ